MTNTDARVGRYNDRKTKRRFPAIKVAQIAGKLKCESYDVLVKAGATVKKSALHSYLTEDRIPHALTQELEKLYEKVVVGGKDMEHG